MFLNKMLNLLNFCHVSLNRLCDYCHVPCVTVSVFQPTLPCTILDSRFLLLLCNLGRQVSPLQQEFRVIYREQLVMKIFLVNSFQTFPGNYFNHGLSFATRVRPSPPMFQKTCPLSHRIQKGQDIGGRDTPPL